MRRILLVLLLVAGLSAVARGALPCEVLSVQPSCYAAMQPGPVEDALTLTRISDARTFASTGELRLTTVAVEADLDLREWIEGAISPRIRHVPRETLFPQDRDRDEILQENAALMQGSQLDATVAALTHLGYDVDEDFDGAIVADIATPTAVRDEELRVGDVITAVEGTSTLDNRSVGETIRTYAPGDTVELTVLRDGRERTVEIELIANPDDPAAAYIGVLLLSHLELPLDVDIDAGVIGGPSAGLLFALAIVDLLDPEDLTGGTVVAGTGTIGRDGRVGAVGGITQKILGATEPVDGRPPATTFLVPRGNLDEARGTPVGSEVLLVPVGTLEEAVQALADLRAGRQPDEAFALAGP